MGTRFAIGLRSLGSFYCSVRALVDASQQDHHCERSTSKPGGETPIHPRHDRCQNVLALGDFCNRLQTCSLSLCIDPTLNYVIRIWALWRGSPTIASQHDEKSEKSEKSVLAIAWIERNGQRPSVEAGRDPSWSDAAFVLVRSIGSIGLIATELVLDLSTCRLLDLTKTSLLLSRFLSTGPMGRE